MTIGIGALGSESKNLPDTIVLIADTKGSFGGAYSMNRLHKLFYDKDAKVCATAADGIDRAAELFTLIQQFLGKWNTGSYGNLLDSIHSAAEVYKRIKFKTEVLPRFAYLPNSIPEMFTEQDLNPQLLRRWQRFYVGCEMLVGAFDKDGQAYLFWLDGKGGVQNFSTPGFAAIGSGAENAMFWLSYRNHNKSYSPKRTAYHVFEAKIMSESSPFVNEKMDILVARRDKWTFISDSHPIPADSPVTVEELRKLFDEEYGPKSTEAM